MKKISTGVAIALMILFVGLGSVLARNGGGYGGGKGGGQSGWHGGGQGGGKGGGSDIGSENILFSAFPSEAFPSEDTIMDPNDEMWSQVEGISVPVMPMMIPELWGQSNTVELKSLHNDTDVYIYARWADLNQSVFKSMWVKTSDGWTNSGANEDRMGFAWDIDGSLSRSNGFGPRGGVAVGCATLCHVDPDDPNKLTMSTAYTGGVADLWQWKAARTNPVGYSDDQYFDNVNHKGDEGVSTYRENKSEDGSKPGYMFAFEGGVGTSPYLFEDEATPFSDNLFDGDALPGYVLRTPSGDRANVEAVGVWVDGYWTVVFKRSLRTESENDVQFTANANYPFGISIFDNAGNEKHLKSHPLYLWLE